MCYNICKKGEIMPGFITFIGTYADTSNVITYPVDDTEISDYRWSTYTTNTSTPAKTEIKEDREIPPI